MALDRLLHTINKNGTNENNTFFGNAIQHASDRGITFALSTVGCYWAAADALFVDYLSDDNYVVPT